MFRMAKRRVSPAHGRLLSLNRGFKRIEYLGGFEWTGVVWSPGVRCDILRCCLCTFEWVEVRFACFEAFQCVFSLGLAHFTGFSAQ